MQSFISVAQDLKGSYWLTEQLSFEFLIPYRLTHVDASFLNSEGAFLPDDFESIHHRDEIVQGVGDIRIGLGYSGDLDELWSGSHYAIKLGMTIPTGSVEPDPFLLGSQKLWHQHIFFGNGTFDPWGEGTLTVPIGPVNIIFWGLFVTPLYRGEYEYRGSKVVMASFGFTYSFTESFSAYMTQDLYFETSASWGENVALNSGRLDLLASIGGQWDAFSDFRIAFGIRRPYASFTDGHQLKIPWAGNLELMYDF